MTVSRENSKAVYQGIKDAGVRSISALPETWLVYLLQLASNDPEMHLIEVAKEEEAIGIAAGAYFAGESIFCSCRITAFWPPSTASSRWRSCIKSPYVC